MRDFNDLFYFVQVVDHGNFSRAAEVLGIAKSKLSRRIAQLEQRLGVRLIQRSTRKFSVTELGQDFYRHALAMVVEADAAHEVIERTKTEPQGVVRVSCPNALLYFRVADMITRYMAANPLVQVQLEGVDRPVDVIGEGIDIALRVRFPPLDDSGLAMRVLSDSSQRLVASPALLAGFPDVLAPADLALLPSADWGPAGREHVWRLRGLDGAAATVHHRPRLVTGDLVAMRAAAVNGVAVAQLPTLFIQDDLLNNLLVEVLPQWLPRSGIVHAVFPSRRGLLPAVRGLLDFLVAEFQELAGAEAAMAAKAASAAAKSE
ncbi:MAG: LysR substrate-binding domain-containing protein [Steroidobacteraceae bacterium]